MAIILKASYRTVLTQASSSSHQFSLSVRTKVADLTQLKSESARLYALLQSSVDNAIQNNGSVPRSRNGNREWHLPRIRPRQRDQNHQTWACGRKQKKLLLRFIADYNLDWSAIERLAQQRFSRPVRALNQPQARELIRAWHE